MPFYCGCEEKWKVCKENKDYRISSKGRYQYKNNPIGFGYINNKKKRYRRNNLGLIHSIMSSNFVGEKPENHDIDHKNQIKEHNCLCNLHYIPISENQENKEWKNKKGCIKKSKYKNKKYFYFNHRIDKEYHNIKCNSLEEAKELQDIYILIQDMKNEVSDKYEEYLIKSFN